MTARLANWLDERVGWRRAWEAVFLRKVPKVNWFYTLGSATLFVALNQIITGILLTIYYVPTPDQAYDSVQYITAQVPAGWLIRGLHHWGASAMVLLTGLHMLRVIFTGAYKFPREVTWFTGVALLLIVVGFGFTGYLLPWDQKAFWATTVGTRIAAVTPLIGEWILRVLRGGAEISAVTLARFFGVHVWMLPAALLVLVGLHLYLVVRIGISAVPRRQEQPMNDKEKRDYLDQYGREKQQGEQFFPDSLVRDALVSLAIFLVLVALAYFVGAPLEARADPSDATYTPRPEWYFLFLFQLLKKFPGRLEVVGVIVLPALVLTALVLLPFLDRSAKRHFLNRPVFSGAALLVILAVVGLSVQAVREAPPPVAVQEGDEVAALYAQNCASCHGPSVTVPSGTDLHRVIAEGRHEGMPAWSADLTSDQIDALAGFILSPGGSQLFAQNCGACHDVEELVAGDPLQSRQALDSGLAFAPHADTDVPDFSTTLAPSDRTTLLNFLAAPDGQRLFTLNCSPCHGRGVSFSGTEDELRSLIAQGGLHLEMPPWRERLSDEDLEILAQYVVDPSSTPQGEELFGRYCSECHGQRVPNAVGLAEARQIISSGGAHVTMPIWGDVLTTEQLNALVVYTLQAARGAPTELGQQLFAQNCASCHGDFGEGGPNPTRAGDVIAPISSREYLTTRDDATLRAVISEGQPDFGMSPFAASSGGPLDDDEIDAIVAFLRTWEENPPVEVPPEVVTGPVPLHAAEIFRDICARCHGPAGEGGLGPTLRGSEFTARYNDQQLNDVINLGHEATPMIAWGEILTAEQIRELVTYIRSLQAPISGTPSSGPSFARDVLPILQENCAPCHGSLGGWDGSSYSAVMTSGSHAPVVIPGDSQGSLLAQKILGTQTEGGIMPPSGRMADDLVQMILDWIAAGAPDN